MDNLYTIAVTKQEIKEAASEAAGGASKSLFSSSFPPASSRLTFTPGPWGSRSSSDRGTGHLKLNEYKGAARVADGNNHFYLTSP